MTVFCLAETCPTSVTKMSVFFTAFPPNFYSQLIWSEIYDFGLLSNNVVLFSVNAVSITHLFSVNVVSKTR